MDRGEWCGHDGPLANKTVHHTILDAKYLTNTNEEWVALEVFPGEDCDGDEILVKAMKLYCDHFPLSSPTAWSSPEQQLQYDEKYLEIQESRLAPLQ